MSPLPNNDYTQRRDLNRGRGQHDMRRTRRLHDGSEVVGIGCGTLILIWLLAKVLAIPVLVINVISLIQAIQAGTVGTFDFTWLVISLAGLVLL